MTLPRGSHEQSVRVASADCGGDGLLSPQGILRMMQDAATAGSDAAGLTHAMLLEHGLIFMTSTHAVRFLHPIAAGDTLRVRTDPAKLHGPHFLRQTLFFDEAGALAAEGQSDWVLVDAHSGRPRRSTDLPGTYDVLAQWQPFCDPSRLRFPTATTVRDVYPVTEADADLNGHMNNAVYARLLMCCEPEIKGVSEFALRYHRQCFPGETLTLCRDGEYAAGYLGEALCFSGYCRGF